MKLMIPAVTAGVLAILLLGLASWLSQPWTGRGEPLPETKRADPARLEAHARALSERFAPRAMQNPDRLLAVADYLSNELRSFGLTPREQPYAAGGATYKNIIARLGPEHGELVVVGAHYDAAGPFPGADDNASGVAVLLELARLLAQERWSSPIELVFYTLEEEGFRTDHMGSAVHARSLAAQQTPVRAMFSLEMLGCFTDAPDTQTYPVGALSLLYPTTGNFIAVVGSLSDPGLVRTIKRAMRGASELPVESINAPRSIRGIDFSDHRSYWDLGYPAVMVTDTAFFRNPRYHTAHDTADTLDYRRMAEVARGVYAAVLALTT